MCWKMPWWWAGKLQGLTAEQSWGDSLLEYTPPRTISAATNATYLTNLIGEHLEELGRHQEALQWYLLLLLANRRHNIVVSKDDRQIALVEMGCSYTALQKYNAGRSAQTLPCNQWADSMDSMQTAVSLHLFVWTQTLLWAQESTPPTITHFEINWSRVLWVS